MADTVLPVPRVIRVSDLTRYLRYLVEHDELLTQLSVAGEVTDFSRSPSGHCYFSLKDGQSQISCVLFRREAASQRVHETLRSGLSVVVHGFLTVYEPRGSCQIYVQRVVPQGEGLAARQLARLRERLEQEGLFAPERKRQLPRFPRRIALVTAPGSQAYHDVLHRIAAQYPFVRVIEAGVRVQGDGAADEMAMAIDIVNRLTDCDVILLVRGGGAPEELAAFNEERLARAVFASRIPVVAGIGHETDRSLVDEVADVRAATPSLAAAAAVPDARGIVEQIGQLHAQSSQALDQRLRLEKRRLLSLHQALVRASPENRLHLQRRRTESATATLQAGMRNILVARRMRSETARLRLESLNPLAILGRGYAVLTDGETGAVIKSVERTQPGQSLVARVADGQFKVKVSQH
ncbi:MAG TPA: exodeoxyribonuclease VII large subunit [Chloroflexota bacterium]